ncbi:MAG: SLC13/DASS family transporter [Flavobacteriales bacterium]|nr:SLC13/DASS family transporter [Flavobacteriales bacterium]
MKRWLFLLAGPLLAVLVFALMRHHGPQPAFMAGLVAWMALWWITEAVPIPVTSILPLVLFPLLGIDSVPSTASNYGKEIIFLFLGGFIIALGIERCGLHKRIALGIMARVGGSSARLVLGIMVACALLSMWINSTAATLVMLPIALSLIDDDDAPEPVRKRLTVPLLLGVAYGATIGGMATPVGTPPNLVFLELWRQIYPEAPSIGFGQWMAVGLPLAILFMVVAWLLLTRFVFKLKGDTLGEADAVRERLRGLGRASVDEWLAGSVFAMVALLWISGDDLRLGEDFLLAGWRSRFGMLKGVSDAAIAVLGAVLLFVIPAGKRIRQAHDPYATHEESRTLMDWTFAERRVPWGVLLLIGGGFALAAGVDKAGLSGIIGEAMAGLGSLPMVMLIGSTALVVCLLSELGSNTATASLALPILAAMAQRWGMDPQSILWPATLAASLGFMLPVASPMQTIVFGTGRIPMQQMVKAGVWMDLIGVLLLMLFFGWG